MLSQVAELKPQDTALTFTEHARAPSFPSAHAQIPCSVSSVFALSPISVNLHNDLASAFPVHAHVGPWLPIFPVHVYKHA